MSCNKVPPAIATKPFRADRDPFNACCTGACCMFLAGSTVPNPEDEDFNASSGLLIITPIAATEAPANVSSKPAAVRHSFKVSESKIALLKGFLETTRRCRSILKQEIGALHV